MKLGEGEFGEYESMKIEEQASVGEEERAGAVTRLPVSHSFCALRTFYLPFYPTLCVLY